ncbi:unnamed protein product [Anisakis simplex]|uniref:DUF1262 family protein n=1 Tax=Anisakis simplex TaxID=6269 RepID=A0A0M3KIB3_ANISI|nr:unnamed protein product [Anisakis simplex]
MSSSRSSFLELIGLKKKKKEREVCVKHRELPPARTSIKKRKRKISESDSIQSSGEQNQKIEKRQPPSSYSSKTSISIQHYDQQPMQHRPIEQHKKLSLLQTPKQYKPMRHSRTSPRCFDESDDDEDENRSVSRSRSPAKPKTPFLEPDGIPSKSMPSKRPTRAIVTDGTPHSWTVDCDEHCRGKITAFRGRSANCKIRGFEKPASGDQFVVARTNCIPVLFGTGGTLAAREFLTSTAPSIWLVPQKLHLRNAPFLVSIVADS